MKKSKIAITSFVLILALMLGVVSLLGVSAASDNSVGFEEKVKSLFFEKYQFISDDYWNNYQEVYQCFSSDDATSDYVLLHTCATSGDMVSVEVIGNYVMAYDQTCFPYELGYFVYVPSENTLLTLAEAFSADIECIDIIYKEGKIEIELIGDADADRKITVKDATWIQKVAAGYEMIAKWDDFIYDRMEKIVRDFNRDGAVNVQDATAIQKYIAGIAGDYSDDIVEPVSNPFSSLIAEDADYEDDCILVSTKYAWGHNYTLEDFPEYEFSSIEKIGGIDGKGYAIYKLNLKNSGRENVVEAIKSLDYRAERDLFGANPNYIYYIEWDE